MSLQTLQHYSSIYLGQPAQELDGGAKKIYKNCFSGIVLNREKKGGSQGLEKRNLNIIRWSFGGVGGGTERWHSLNTRYRKAAESWK